MKPHFPIAAAAGLLLALSCFACAAADEQPSGVPAPEAQAQSAAGLASGEAALMDAFAAGRLDGAYLNLESSGGGFLARYEQAVEHPAAGALLVVPDHAQLITNEGAIDALLEEFPANGWAVMAIQPALLAPHAELSTYVEAYAPLRERLAAACARLAADGIARIVLVGLEGGAGFAHRFALEDAASASVAAFAGRGAWRGELGEQGRPVIEFFGEFDHAASAASAVRAKQARRAGLSHRRYLFAGVGVDTSATHAEFARGLRGWIKTALGGAPATASR